MSAKREVWTFQFSILAMLSITLADDGWMKTPPLPVFLQYSFPGFGILELWKLEKNKNIIPAALHYQTTSQAFLSTCDSDASSVQFTS